MKKYHGTGRLGHGARATIQETSAFCYLGKNWEQQFQGDYGINFHPQIPKVWVISSLYQNALGLFAMTLHPPINRIPPGTLPRSAE